MVSVCNPVKRVVSRYYHALAIRPDTRDVLGDFENYQQQLLDYASNATTSFDGADIQTMTDAFLGRVFSEILKIQCYIDNLIKPKSSNTKHHLTT